MMSDRMMMQDQITGISEIVILAMASCLDITMLRREMYSHTIMTKTTIRNLKMLIPRRPQLIST